MANDLTGEQWTQLLSLLSLDGALPLYEAMGVPVDDKRRFQQILREVILQARKAFEVTPNHVPSVASMFFDRLDSRTGERFAKWAQGIFLGYHADQPQWSAWDIVFSQWAYSRRRDLEFLPESKRKSFIEGYKRNAETNDLRRKGEELINQPLSDWDLEMYARRNYGISWEASPFSTAEAITRIERLKIFAGHFWQDLTATERAEIQKQAQALIDVLRVWMPGRLPSLESLLREL